MPDTIMTGAIVDHSRTQPLLTGTEMRELWTAYEAARAGYSEDDEERTSAIYTQAMDRILAARTVDPEGIAIKVKLLDERGDCPKGLLPDVFKDVFQPQGAPASPPRRSSAAREMSLRPLWESYRKAWKYACDVMDEEDAAMLARPKTAEPGSTEAEKAAKEKRKRADQAFDAASDALESAPTRTIDDAVCRILHAIDLADSSTNADLIISLNKALRVLRKVNAESQTQAWQ